MGLFARLFERRAAPSPSSAFTVPSVSSFGFADIKRNPTVSASVNVIANSISILPLNLYFKNPRDGSRQKAGWHPLYTILRRRPNLAESPTLFVANMLRHILTQGNAYIYRNKVGGQIASLHLLNPEAVRETYSGMTVTYWYNSQPYTDADILHIPSLITDDHGKGFAPVEMARIAVTLGIQLDEYSLSSFGNGLNTKLLLDIADMTAGTKDQDQAQKLAKTVSDYVRRNYSGPENAGKPLVLWSGMKATELAHQSSNAEAQLLEMRKYQELEICKIFGVPPFLINGSYDVKYGGLEQAMTVFSNFTLGPYLRHIEQRLNSLLTEYESEAYYFEFDLNVLLRPDEKSRAEFYSKLFNMGAMSPGQIAAKENIDPPTEGADARFVPANMMPLRQDVLDAYMASAKQKAADMNATPTPTDPSLSTGSQAQ
jgi:HK97 family phage portal protein